LRYLAAHYFFVTTAHNKTRMLIISRFLASVWQKYANFTHINFGANKNKLFPISYNKI